MSAAQPDANAGVEIEVNGVGHQADSSDPQSSTVGSTEMAEGTLRAPLAEGGESSLESKPEGTAVEPSTSGDKVKSRSGTLTDNCENEPGGAAATGSLSADPHGDILLQLDDELTAGGRDLKNLVKEVMDPESVSLTESDASIGDVPPHQALNQDLATKFIQESLRSNGVVSEGELQALFNPPSDLEKMSDSDLVVVALKEKLQRMVEGERVAARKLAEVCQERDGLQQAARDLEASRKDVHGLQAKITVLERDNKRRSGEVLQLEERLAHQAAGAEKQLNGVRTDMVDRIEKVTKMYEDSVKEKEAMVMRFASGEKRALDLQHRMDRGERALKEAAKIHQQLQAKLDGAKQEKAKMAAAYDAKCGELTSLQREMDKCRETANASDQRVRWAQGKLKVELDHHKETKGKLESTERKLRVAREETETIRGSCQQMIKTYQESEDMRSNSLDKQLHEKLAEMERQQKQHSNQEEVFHMIVEEHENLKKQHQQLKLDSQQLRDKLASVETDGQEKGAESSRLSQEVTTLQSKLQDFEQLTQTHRLTEQELKSTQEEAATAHDALQTARQAALELETDLSAAKSKECELLAFTERLTAKLSSTTSESQGLSSRLEAAERERKDWKGRWNTAQTDFTAKLAELEGSVEGERTAKAELQQQLLQRDKTVGELQQRVADEVDNNKLLRRKHALNTKDLTRELGQLRRRAEGGATEGGPGGVSDRLSAGSRTSSTGSLETSHLHALAQPPAQEPQTFPEVEVDKDTLIKKVVSLQRQLARRREKLEFLQDHVTQLTKECQKKSRIIQSFALRQESGQVAPESMDRNKAEVAKRGGIMSSVYGRHVKDQYMTMELALQITHKLQSVLEDTLLKNITLKESLDTLGSEIARLSQENRKLQTAKTRKT